MSFTGAYRIDSLMVLSGMRSSTVLAASTSMMASPIARTAFRSPKTVPSSLSIHPSMTKETNFLARLDAIINARQTAAKTSTNERMPSKVPFILTKGPAHTATFELKVKDSHAPSTIAAIEKACFMNPFLNPCTRAGMRQTRIMTSSMFTVNLLIKSVGMPIFAHFKSRVCGRRIPAAKLERKL